MERLTEEKITKFLIKYLKLKGFKIFAYDFPQSGTGYVLRPNSSDIKHKNINFWIPDIIAIKNKDLYVFENKDHFSLSDIKKIQTIFHDESHSEAIDKLLSKTRTINIFTMLAFPISHFNETTQLDKYISAEVGCDVLKNEVQVKASIERIYSEILNT